MEKGWAGRSSRWTAAAQPGERRVRRVAYAPPDAPRAPRLHREDLQRCPYNSFSSFRPDLSRRFDKKYI